MKTTIHHLFALTLACLVPLLPSCGTTGALNPAASTGVTIGTGLILTAYPLAAPFAETVANAIRQEASTTLLTPAQLDAKLAIYQAASDLAAGKISTAATSEVNGLFSTVEAAYAKSYPAIVKGEMTVESFAQAVETGA